MLLKWNRLVGAAVLLAMSSVTTLAQDSIRPLDEGWWVVVASEPLKADGTPVHDNRDAIVAAIGKCGFEPFNDYSEKFGFKPGYNVFVLGAYAKKAEADAIRVAIKKCAPDAYLKTGRYQGE